MGEQSSMPKPKPKPMSTPRPQIGLPIYAAHRPGVIVNFERLAQMAIRTIYRGSPAALRAVRRPRTMNQGGGENWIESPLGGHNAIF
jgi:hypothetical protein